MYARYVLSTPKAGFELITLRDQESPAPPTEQLGAPSFSVLLKKALIITAVLPEHINIKAAASTRHELAQGWYLYYLLISLLASFAVVPHQAPDGDRQKQ